MDAMDLGFGMVGWAFCIFITARVLHEERGDGIDALRAEIECRIQPDDCDAKRLTHRRRDR